MNKIAIEDRKLLEEISLCSEPSWMLTNTEVDDPDIGQESISAGVPKSDPCSWVNHSKIVLEFKN